jgi:RNA polymerase sigma factor (sigma-70 family)
MSESTIDRLDGLLARLQRGEPDVARQLVEASYDRLRAKAHHLLRYDPLGVAVAPTEVVNEAYVRLVKAIEDAKPPTVDDFLRLAALKFRQQAIDLARAESGRRKKRYRVDVDSGLFERLGQKCDSPSIDATRNQFLEAVCQRVRTFTAGERHLFYLLSVRGISQKTAAELLDVHVSTVKDRFRALKLKLYQVVESCLVGEKLRDLSAAQQAAAFDAVEEPLLQGYWQDLNDFLESLDPRDQKFVNLLGWLGFSEAEAAAAMGVDEATLVLEWSSVRAKLPPTLRHLMGV